MNKKIKLYRALTAVFSTLTVICAAVVVCALTVPHLGMRIEMFFTCIAGTVVFPIGVIVFHCLSNDMTEKRIKLFHAFTVFMAVVYAVFFLGILFFIKAYSNGTSFSVSYDRYWLMEALPSLIPFRSIFHQINNFAMGKTSFLQTLFGIGGNFVLYMPLSFYLPVFFKGFRKSETYFTMVLFFIVFIEMLQGMFSIGTCEIDDFILGLCGTMLSYAFLKIPFIRNLFDSHGIYFDNKEKKNG